jgi:hypothetical protein
MDNDQPFTTPGLTRPPRQAHAGERLWTLQKGTTRMVAQLRDDTAVGAGAELQLFHDGDLIYGRRHESRELALEEAVGCRRDFEADGWQGEH